MRRRTIAGAALVMASICIAGRPAAAETAGLQHAQSGALLAYAESELGVLYAALSGREFDVEIIKRMLDELKRSIGDAKASVDRTTDLLEDAQAKAKPSLLKLREHLKTAEDDLGRLTKDVDEQVRAAPPEEAEGGDEAEGEGEAAPKVAPDWPLLKADVGWLAFEISEARRLHGKLAGMVATPKLAPPPKPKGKRPS